MINQLRYVEREVMMGHDSIRTIKVLQQYTPVQGLSYQDERGYRQQGCEWVDVPTVTEEELTND